MVSQDYFINPLHCVKENGQKVEPYEYEGLIKNNNVNIELTLSFKVVPGKIWPVLCVKDMQVEHNNAM